MSKYLYGIAILGPNLKGTTLRISCYVSTSVFSLLGRYTFQEEPLLLFSPAQASQSIVGQF